jgi:hypothetical protein
MSDSKTPREPCESEFPKYQHNARDIRWKLPGTSTPNPMPPWDAPAKQPEEKQESQELGPFPKDEETDWSEIPTSIMDKVMDNQQIDISHAEWIKVMAERLDQTAIQKADDWKLWPFISGIASAGLKSKSAFLTALQNDQNDQNDHAMDGDELDSMADIAPELTPVQHAVENPDTLEATGRQLLGGLLPIFFDLDEYEKVSKLLATSADEERPEHEPEREPLEHVWLELD